MRSSGTCAWNSFRISNTTKIFRVKIKQIKNDDSNFPFSIVNIFNFWTLCVKRFKNVCSFDVIVSTYKCLYTNIHTHIICYICWIIVLLVVLLQNIVFKIPFVLCYQLRQPYYDNVKPNLYNMLTFIMIYRSNHVFFLLIFFGNVKV